MNILHLLKSRAGEISKLGLLGMSITLGMGGLSIYNYATSSEAAQEQKVRSLASIMSSGGEMPREYQSMNFSMGKNQFASAEERAKMEGQMADKVFNGGEDAAAAVEGLNFGPNGTINGVGGIEGSALGAGEAGLGMGANEVAELAGNGRARGSAQKGSTEGVDAAAAEQGKKEGNKLQRASMARAGGSNLGSGASFGGNSGSAAGTGRLASSARMEGQSRIGAGSITGAMGGNGPLVKANPAFQGAHSSSFVSGSRYGRTGTGINSEAGNNLRLIAKQSSKVAANRNRAANEGSSPFMADTKLAAGITVDGMETGTSFGAMGDDSFDKGLDAKLGDLNTAVDEADTQEAERKAERSALAKELVGLLIATIAAMLSISYLMELKLPWSYAVAAILGAAMLVWIGTYMARAGKFAHKFDNDPVGITFAVIAGVVAVGIAISFIPKVANGIMKKIVTPCLKGLGMATPGGAASVGSLGLGSVTKAFDGVKSNVESMKSENKDDSNLSNGDEGK